MSLELPLKFEISFLSLNTMGAPLKRKLKKRYQEISNFLKECHVDFFALQETFHQKNTQDLILKPQADQKVFVASGGQKDLKRFKTTGSGLTSLSRHPIVQEKFFAFQKAQSVDRLANKGILLTRICLASGVEVDFYNTHLQASYFYRNQNSKTRIKQLHEIANFVHQNSKPQNMIFLLGDFNFKETTKEYDLFQNVLWQETGFLFSEVMRSLHPCSQSNPLYTYQNQMRKNLREKIDHKFMHVGSGWHWQKDQSQTQILDWNVSDHHPILTKLVFSQKS